MSSSSTTIYSVRRSTVRGAQLCGAHSLALVVVCGRVQLFAPLLLWKLPDSALHTRGYAPHTPCLPLTVRDTLQDWDIWLSKPDHKGNDVNLHLENIYLEELRGDGLLLYEQLQVP